MNLSRHQPLSEIVLIVGAPQDSRLARWPFDVRRACSGGRMVTRRARSRRSSEREPGVSLEGNVIGRWIQR
jgi:hypothetical protein